LPVCFLFCSLEINGASNEDTNETEPFWQNPSGVLISFTGNSEIFFNRIGLKGEIYYHNELHRFKGGLIFNFIDPLYFDENTLVREWYQYVPAFSSGISDNGHLLLKMPSSDNQNTPGLPGTDIQLQPGVALGYEFHPLGRKDFSLSPFIDFKTQYQFQRGEIVGLGGLLWRTEFDGLFHVFSSLMGIGFEYEPFESWAFRLSSTTGIGLSRVYTDHEDIERIEEILNRTFNYGVFELGVRYRFSEKEN